jgi:hypothetical protein
VLANFLGIPDRSSWKKAVVSKEEEQKQAERIREILKI